MSRIQKISSLVFFLAFFSQSLLGQHFLLLKKSGTAKSHKIQLNDVVKIKTASNLVFKGDIQQISSDALMVDNEIVEFKDIVSIRTTKAFMHGLGRSLEIGGIFLTGIYVANALVTNLNPILTSGNIIFLGSIIGTGILLELFSHKTYRFKNGWSISSINFNDI